MGGAHGRQPRGWIAELDQGGGRESPYPTAYVRTPFVVVDRGQRRLDPAYFGLNAAWRAPSPAAARTVILSSYRRLVVGRYQGWFAIPAYSCTAGYEFVDLGTRRVIATHIQTNMPPPGAPVLLRSGRAACPQGADLARYIGQVLEPYLR